MDTTPRIGGQTQYGVSTNIPYAGSSQAASNASVPQTNIPSVVSNYKAQSKINDITTQHQDNVNTSTPTFPSTYKPYTAVYADATPGQTGELLGYASSQEEENALKKNYGAQTQTSFGTSFTAPEEAQLQPNGTYLYQGQYYTKDQLSSPESLAAINNTALQQKKYDDALASQLDAINKRYDQYRREQEQINAGQIASTQNALLQSGAGGRGSVSQYAAATADSRVTSVMQDGQRALQKLDAQRDDLISQAKMAYQDKNFQLLDKLNTQIKANRDEMISATKKANEALQTATDQATKDNNIASVYDSGITDPTQILSELQKKGIKNVTLKDITDSIDRMIPTGIKDLLTTLRNAGAPADVIQKVLSSKDSAEAYKNAGTWASTGGTGIIGEYNYYRAQAEAAGQNPVDFNTYQNMDANRKAKVASAGVAGSLGLTTAQSNLATKLSDDYEQRSKDFYTIRDAYNKIVSSSKNPSAAGDMALLFGYMKLLDPNSVVRETEYATAQNAGSIPERIRAQYNAALNGKKLDPAQRLDFVDRSKKIFETSKQQQDVLKSDFEKRAVKYGIPSDLVVRETDALGDTIVTSEKEAGDTLYNYKETHPEKVSEISSRIDVMEKQLGRHITAIEFLEAFPEYK